MKKEYLPSGFVTALTFTTVVLTISIVLTPLLPLQSAHAASVISHANYPGPRTSIALSGNNIYVAWWDNKTGNNEISFARSTDNGKTFDKTINLSNAKGASADSQIATQGYNVYVSWWDNQTGSWNVFSRASTDGGKTFGDAVMLKSIGSSPLKKLTAPPSDTIPVDTAVAASGNNEYVMWWDNKTGNWEVSFAKSTDNGKTFGSPMNISNSSDAHSLGARIAADQGSNVYISWVDIDEKTGQKQVLFRASNDNGQAFGNPVMLNSTTTGR
jgi:hypothetical protein